MWSSSSLAAVALLVGLFVCCLFAGCPLYWKRIVLAIIDALIGELPPPAPPPSAAGAGGLAVRRSESPVRSSRSMLAEYAGKPQLPTIFITRPAAPLSPGISPHGQAALVREKPSPSPSPSPSGKTALSGPEHAFAFALPAATAGAPRQQSTPKFSPGFKAGEGKTFMPGDAKPAAAGATAAVHSRRGLSQGAQGAEGASR
ncbi:hypothetical protein T492DRAFT_1104469, partial [Pavlovales sp. CCMP2436]